MDEQPALLQPLPAAFLEPDVDELLEGERVGGADLLLVAVDLHRHDAHARHGGELGDLGERVGDDAGQRHEVARR